MQRRTHLDFPNKNYKDKLHSEDYEILQIVKQETVCTHNNDSLLDKDVLQYPSL